MLVIAHRLSTVRNASRVSCWHPCQVGVIVYERDLTVADYVKMEICMNYNYDTIDRETSIGRLNSQV